MAEQLEAQDWTFRHIKASEGIHGLHHYPAMMAPPVARTLIEALTRPGDTVLDPFCGSGTVTTEAALLGRRSVGLDINRLGLLIAQVKATPLRPTDVADAYERIRAAFFAGPAPKPPAFTNIEFWFKPAVIDGLARLKRAIGAVDPPAVRDFFWVLFSRVVRQSSNTRDNEFKLFRLPPAKLEAHDPDVWTCFERRYEEGLRLMSAFFENTGGSLVPPELSLHDSRLPLPVPPLPRDGVALMLTSPPYGDSRTTVAYGQFCRLSLQWLDRWERDLDRLGLGGRGEPPARPYPVDPLTPLLREALAQVARVDGKRAAEAEAFYADLHACLLNIAQAISPGGYGVFVIANRKVRGVLMPSDEIIREMMEMTSDFEHLVTLHREIPNKRMPLRNSPLNIPGETDHTMLHEHIVVLTRPVGAG